MLPNITHELVLASEGARSHSLQWAGTLAVCLTDGVRQIWRNRIGAPPNALGNLPFPASVVNTYARKRIGFWLSGGGTEAGKEQPAAVTVHPSTGGNVCLRLCPIRVPFSRVFGALIERRQSGTRRPGVAAGNRWGCFRTGKGTVGRNRYAIVEDRRPRRSQLRCFGGLSSALANP